MMSQIKTILLITICLQCSNLVFAQNENYADGRPSAKFRIPCSDEGVVFRHGDGKDSIDVFGAREAVVNKVKDTYYLFYDGAGKDGWRACLATSKDLKTWQKKGAILELGDSTQNDSKSASSPWVIEDKGTWHMFYLGTPNASPAPDRVPSFPYLTMKAEAPSIAGPWKKQYDVSPFTLKPNTFYSLTASPGFIINYKNEFLQFFSGSMNDGKAVKRTLGIARTNNLDGSWKIIDTSILPPEEQIENSSLFFDENLKTWYLFTNHIGITKDNVEYTDAIWVYWTKDPFQWKKEDKAIVLDKQNNNWAKGAIGMPTVVIVGNKLAMLYDATSGESISHMKRDIGLAWITLPIKVNH